jgi:hypothetical protein
VNLFRQIITDRWWHCPSIRPSLAAFAHLDVGLEALHDEVSVDLLALPPLLAGASGWEEGHHPHSLRPTCPTFGQ